MNLISSLVLLIVWGQWCAEGQIQPVELGKKIGIKVFPGFGSGNVKIVKGIGKVKVIKDIGKIGVKISPGIGKVKVIKGFGKSNVKVVKTIGTGTFKAKSTKTNGFSSASNQFTEAIFLKLLVGKLGNFDSAIVACDYAGRYCHYKSTPFASDWKVHIGNVHDTFSSSGKVENASLAKVMIISPTKTGPKCLMFTTSTSHEHIFFTVQVNNGPVTVISSIGGGKKLEKKVSVGIHMNGDPYQVYMKLNNYKYNESGTIGSAWIGKVFLKDGLCLSDQNKLVCKFSGTLCGWIHNMKQHDWYPIPIKLEEGPAGKPKIAVWGALGAMEGKGNMWSPVVKSSSAGCFQFEYVKANNLSLKVWFKFKMAEKNLTLLLFEDNTVKKEVQTVRINLYTGHQFQVQFEGLSENAFHSTVVLNTYLHKGHCPGIGVLHDLKTEVKKIIPNQISSFIGAKLFKP